MRTARTMVVRAAINERRKPWRRERSYGSEVVPGHVKISVMKGLDPGADPNTRVKVDF